MNIQAGMCSQFSTKCFETNRYDKKLQNLGFAKVNPQKIAKDLKNLTKVEKFRPILSH